MSDIKLKYVLGTARYANADNLSGNIKISLPSSNRLLEESDVIELVSLVQRYDRERQASSIHRPYGRLGFITTNELTNYKPLSVTLMDDLNKTDNYNLQLLYPSSHTSDLSLVDFSCDYFPLLSSDYDNVSDSDNHKIYHGLPFIKSRSLNYNGRMSTVINTYKHKNYNNIQPEDYVYLIPGKDGTNGSFYGMFKVNNTALDDGTANVLILDTNIGNNYSGSYKKVTNVSDNDIKFINTIDCELYVMSVTNNELFICTSEQHNVIPGDFIDLRESGGTTYNQYNGIHKVSKVISGFIFVCDVPSHLLSPSISYPSNSVPDISYILPKTFRYKFRVLDGDPSEYYLRKFKVINAGDNTSTIYGVEYYLQQLHLSNTIWKSVSVLPYMNCGMEKQSGSDDDRITSYVFNKDVDISKFNDNLGRPLTELYLGVIKRKNVSEFNNLITNFQGGLMYSGVTTFYNTLNLPTYTNTLNKSGLDYFAVTEFNDAGLNVGGEYYGDLCEFSVETLDETILDPLLFRIGKIINGVHVEGYVYEPFKKIRLRYFSTDIEEVDNKSSVFPSYAIPYHTLYRWKIVNPYGFKEVVKTGIKSVDDPFVNGSHYTFSDTSFYLRRQTKDPDSKITVYDASC